MARKFLERGRPARDWDRDPEIVQDVTAWARARGKKESYVTGFHNELLRFHDVLVERHGPHYYEPTASGHRPHPNSEDARAYKDALIANGKIAPKTKVTRWNYVVQFFAWRSEEFTNDTVYERDQVQFAKIASRDKLSSAGGTKSEGTWQPYRLEDVDRIFSAAESYQVQGHAGAQVVSEDYVFPPLMLYTGDQMRNAAYGLRWDQFDFETNVVLSQTKTSEGAIVAIPFPPGLVELFRKFRATKPDARMVFRGGRYPWFDDVRAPDGAKCATCGTSEKVYVYAAPEKDVRLCEKHVARAIGKANALNNNQVWFAHARIERALHARECGEPLPVKSRGRILDLAAHAPACRLKERLFNQRTKRYEEKPVHLHAHRWRKTWVTHGGVLGLSREERAKVSGHAIESSNVMDKIYDLPDIETKREIAGRVDFRAASRDAAAGKRPAAKVDPRDATIAKLEAQVRELSEKNDALVARLDRMLDRMENGSEKT